MELRVSTKEAAREAQEAAKFRAEGDYMEFTQPSTLFPQRRSTRAVTQPPQRGTRGEAVILLHQRGTRGSSRQSLNPLLDISLDQGERILPNLLIDQSAFRFSSFPHSTRQLGIRREEEEATTRPIDHSEHRGKGVVFVAP
ncbi:unnamed protein product [Arabidopsis thaliana]|uniref:Uncharacterized protein n=1 Tax=Arabidopsis thaliana TaxID=3702 RepID=A0A5S9WXL9_ARATH|nr:unnamed protein product [Arabidopsis thaliana]